MVEEENKVLEPVQEPVPATGKSSKDELLAAAKELEQEELAEFNKKLNDLCLEYNVTLEAFHSIVVRKTK